MGFSKRWLAVAFGVALGLAVTSAGSGASALTLQQLADGASITTGSGIVLDDFRVKVKGRRGNRDLSSYEVTVTRDGFDIDVSGAGAAKLKLTYAASSGGSAGVLGGAGAASVLGGLTEAAVSLDAVNPLLGKGAIKERLKAGRRRLDVLKAGLGESDAARFEQQVELAVREVIKLGARRGVEHTATLVEHTFITQGSVPEPAAGWLVCALVAGLALRARRR